MKQLRSILSLVLVTGMMTVVLQSCKKDDKAPEPLKVVSVATELGVALDGATLATGIPVNSSVVVTFDKAIEASTADASSIAIIVNGVNIPSTITVNRATVTVKPNVDMANGTEHVVSVASTLKASDGAPATATEFIFKTYGRANVVPPQSGSQLSYFSFSGNMNDAV